MITKTRIIPDGKKELKKLPILHHKEAEYLYYPITNARCPVGETCVLGGQFVKVGEVIGTRKGSFFEQPIHATASGEIVGIEKHHDQTGKLVDCVILKNDQKYELHESVKDRTDEEIKNLTREELVEIAKEMGLVGLGGSGFPTYIKLNTKEEIDTIVVNGVECEPFLVSDYELMLNSPHELIKGLIYVMQAMKAKKGVIAIKKKYKEIKEVLDFALTEYPGVNIEVAEVGNYYPQGWELETVKSAIGVTIPQGALTAKYGVLIFNVSTLASVYQAVKHRMPVLERFFTLSGDGIKNTSFRARIGTKITDLVQIAGGYLDVEIPKTLVLGGPMMGSNTTTDDVMITHTITSMIVFNNVDYFEEPCIHCAACVYSCPVKIEPVQIMNALKLGDAEGLEMLKVNKCIECGLCSFVCPSKIHLTQYMRDSKKYLREKGI
ncbi:RnfABCDGE type electron transport complex subunit C [Haploplasma axanthum]|uniref:Ion-translocating oxidoreductase complex subunit C n=1 Tax=Haploplasma axanthum TaxID=29552 RepID=A0A449BBC0_HAPAX|nr:RnfABCDGE type electron transport complex subunit C [Haploplasma axanthum]VEU79675.1 Nitrogen fixation protein rnfC [Haploplasma axanthum]